MAVNDNPRRARDIQPAPSRTRDLKQSGHPVVKGILAACSAAALVVSGVGYFTVGKLDSQLSASELNIGKKQRNDDNEALDGAVDILLVGSDSRTAPRATRCPPTSSRASTRARPTARLIRTR